MSALFRPSAAALVAAAISACDHSPSAAERFVEAGKRLASLPDSCLDARVTHLEDVDSPAFSAGELFKIELDSECSDEWRNALSKRGDLICPEDLSPLGRPVEASFFSCVDHPVPEPSQTVILFRDAMHAELLWVTAR